MGDILSQAELNALLASAAEIERRTTRPADDVAANATAYNFRRPDRIAKEQLRSLHFLHDRFARNMATSLSAYLRTMTEVSVVSVEQFAYSDFLLSLPETTAFFSLSLDPLDGYGALEVNPNVAFAMIDRMLGGRGVNAALDRALTEIEQGVVDAAVKLILENLTETWRTIVEVEFKIHGRETRPQMLQVAPANEVVILVAFDLKVGEARGLLNFCVPAMVIETAEEAGLLQGRQRARKGPTDVDRRRLYESLGRVPVAVVAELETLMTAREILALRPGDIVSLGHPIQQPVELRVGDRPKYLGRLVRRGDEAALSVSSSVGQTRLLEGAA